MILNYIIIGLTVIYSSLSLYFFIDGVVSRFSTHHHKWQIRGRNRWGGETYRICLKCRKTYHRVNKPYEDERWEECDPIPELDAQFDENDEYIFNH